MKQRAATTPTAAGVRLTGAPAMRHRITILTLVAAGVIVEFSVPASAQVVTVQVEGGADVMLEDGIERGSEWGGHVAARVGLELLAPLAVQLGYVGAWMPFDGVEQVHVDALQLGLRASLMLAEGLLAGPFLEVNAGVGVIRGAPHLVWDVAVGIEIVPTPDVAIGTALRHYQVLEPTDNPEASSARALAFTLSVTWRTGVDGSTPAPEPAHDRTVVSDVDEDGIPDSRDLCEHEPEDLDGNRDEDGCPDPDNDGDGVPDERDQCPDAPETINGVDDEDGCPDERAASPPVLDEVPPPTPVVQRNRIRFRAGSARVSARFAPSVRRTCRRLAADPSLRVLAVGYTDEQGAVDANLRLSIARAEAVVQQLVRCGVSPERVHVAAQGPARPLCSTGSPRCWARNRRVEFELERP